MTELISPVRMYVVRMANVLMRINVFALSITLGTTVNTLCATQSVATKLMFVMEKETVHSLIHVSAKMGSQEIVVKP